MDGSINFSGTLSGGIDTGGGSEVTITPTLQGGEKIADYSIDNVPGVLYAPNPVSLTAELPLSISENVISIDLSDYATISDLGDYQEKLTAGSYINIDSNNEISCTPPITNVWYTPEPGVQQDVLIGKFTVNEVTQNVYAPSGGASSINYSTEEQDTGIKWADGSTIYQKSYFNVNIGTSNSYSVELSDLSNVNRIWVKHEGSYVNSTIPFPYIHFTAVNIIGYFININNGVPSIEIRKGNDSRSISTLEALTVLYTKSAT